MSVSKEIRTMMVAVSEGRVHPEEATQSVVRFVVEMHNSDRAAFRKLIAGCVTNAASPIGPLHGAGWNDAIVERDQCTRCLRTQYAVPNGSVAGARR